MASTYYWIEGDPPTGLVEEGTDFGALADGYVFHSPRAPRPDRLQHVPDPEGLGLAVEGLNLLNLLITPYTLPLDILYITHYNT
jgi:hypothetical protein